MLRHPRRPRHAGNIRQVTGTGRGQRTALTCCSSLYETQVTQRVPVIRKIFSIRSCVQAEELLQLTRGRLGGEPAVTGLLLNRQVLNWHAEDRKAPYTGKMVPSPNRNQDHPATANFRSDTPQGPLCERPHACCRRPLPAAPTQNPVSADCGRQNGTSSRGRPSAIPRRFLSRRVNTRRAGGPDIRCISPTLRAWSSYSCDGA